MTPATKSSNKTAYDASAAALWGELYGPEQLVAYARALALRHQRACAIPRQRPSHWDNLRSSRRLPLLRRLVETEQTIAATRSRLLAATRRGADVSPAGAWLLDNYFVVLEHAREIRASVSHALYVRLPKLVDGPHVGLPRIYDIAIELVAHTDGRLDAETIARMIREYQSVTPLSLAELWALPAMLRMSLLENVRRMALRADRDRADTEVADRWVARLRDQTGETLAESLAELVRDPPDLTPAFLTRFLQQLRARRADFTPLLWLEQWMADEAMSPDEAMRRSMQRLSLTQHVMANSITSLRMVASFDWAPFVEAMSATEAVLRRDPAAVYARMTFDTRDRYRHVVEELAVVTGRPEPDIAAVAVDLADRRGGDSANSEVKANDPRRNHVGFYLVGAGRMELEAAVSYVPVASERSQRWVWRKPSVAYFTMLIVLVVIALAMFLGPLPDDTSFVVWLGAIVLALIPASETAIAFLNQLVLLSLPPYRMSRLDYRTGVPESDRTLVVVPLLVPSVAALVFDLERLEAQYLANRDPQIRFALLGDFLDADRETMPGDEEIIAAATSTVAALNVKYSPNGDAPPFYYFHRARRWNPGEKVWMGWERKRGKLADLNAFVRGGGDRAFSTIVGNADWVRGVRYVITLDADTTLPVGAAVQLIGTMAHPLNRPSIDARTKRVIRGYGIMQPRVSVSLESANRSRFAAIFSGHPGVDPYTTAVSDVYQDLFGEGTYTGKGIYDVEVFERATAGRFPDNTLLSHDLIEGAFARAGLITDVEVFDDYPTQYLAATRRQHRWIRGDWQLLRWLTSVIPGQTADGIRETPNPLSALSKWKIADNLRRSLLPIATALWLLAAWTVLPGSPLVWTIVILVSIAFPLVLGLMLDALNPPRRQVPRSWSPFYRALGADGVNAAKQFALSVVFLPYQAQIAADAIGRTVWRLTITHRHLLQWLTASQAERSAARTRRETWRHIGPAAVIAAIVALHATLSDTTMTFVVVFAVCWIASPEIARFMGGDRHRGYRMLSAEDRATALRYARTHWNYFDHFVGDNTCWLTPDNVQETPHETVAMRTSPTNIGLQLISTVAAHELGFIARTQMLDRLERALATMDQMPRLHGHFYNWYGLPDLRVLDPPYVSTVDSGNLAGHLMALAEACGEIVERLHEKNDSPDASDVPRLRAVADHARELSMEMDFRMLYDPDRKLFSIGYDERAGRLDASAYDLLASEARLTSFVAIAKGDVPAEHWFHLGRTLTTVGRDTALVSWSGSMFEYLMPLLVMPSRPLSLLNQTHHAAVDRQRAYGRARGVPWGISESAYNLRDRHGTYQYRGFGVPDLALARGLANDLVVAPYASMLAALVNPAEAFRNLSALERDGALGAFGFYDSIDYTRHRPGDKFEIVRTCMAHHVGMSLIALHDALDVEGTEAVWQRRFMCDPSSQAAALLLDERVPRHYLVAPAQSDAADEVPDVPRKAPAEPVVRHYATAMTPEPRVALLGAAPYAVLVTNAGAGYSRAGAIAVNRWRADATRDDTGQWIYLSDVTAGRSWSAAHQPTAALADSYAVTFASDRAVFERRDGPIETCMEIVVLPRERAEVRVVTVTNRSSESRDIDVTSYAEVVLTEPDADRAHPAFQNLFIETEWVADRSAILASRRPRSDKEQRPWCTHVVATGPERVGALTFETDRAAFVGRGRSPRSPRAQEPGEQLTGAVGPVLDPIVSIRARVRVAPGRSAKVAFTTMVSNSRSDAIEGAGRYGDLHASERAISLAGTEAQVELRDRDITPSEATLFQELAGALLYPHEELRASAYERAENRRGQKTLWAHGISGDWPIVLATIDTDAGIETLRHLLTAHEYWRTKGISADLVVLDTKPATYRQDFQDQLMSIVIASTEGFGIDKPGGVFLRRTDVMSDDDVKMLRATARVHVACDGEPLRGRAPGLEVLEQDVAVPGAGRVIVAGVPQPPLQSPVGTLPSAGNGFGQSTADGAYEIHIRDGAVPPAPWSNVIANPQAGFCVTERGGGFSWVENSYFYRLTPWHNDPVCDPLGEVLFLQDGDITDPASVWTPTPGPCDPQRGAAGEYVVRHAPGLTTFAHERNGIVSELALGVPSADPVKITRLRLTNRSDRTRSITLTSYVEWALGAQREHTRHQIYTRRDDATGAIFANNFFTDDYSSRVAFSSVSEPVTGFTANREEFLGRNGDLVVPAGLGILHLSEATGAGFDPCAALRFAVTLAPGATRDIIVLLGAAASEDDARSLIARHGTPDGAKAALDGAVADWERRLTTISVRTPAPEFDAMANRWALYQALSCRMWARSALYQSSGAFGFRDQLQDCMAFVYSEPAVARAHLVRCAGRQFREGDVQHWWHEPGGRGVRTRFSDDLAWLAFVADHYVRVSGDTGVWDERAPYLEQRPLAPTEHDAYDLPTVSGESGTLYEHCVRALDHACTVGPHELPLMGGGDWNDGMDRVGAGGTGESVWLAWFLIATLRRMAEHADARTDASTADRFRKSAIAYAAAAEKSAWDGEWYRRAFFDDGTPLGTAQAEECQIDSIAQSWSVISGAGDPARARQAMQSLDTRLVDHDARLLKLLTPPFDHMTHDPGYIKGYVPGVRENGAQYTHAALWATLATAMLGDGDKAFDLFEMLNPLSHSRSAADVSRYKVEPYAVCADVYTAKDHVGRGGWTWYTGSASWTYRVAIEAILGFTKRGTVLTIDPHIPRAWTEFAIDYRYGGTLYHIAVKNPHGVSTGVTCVVVDGHSAADGRLSLVDDGKPHEAVVTMGMPHG